MNTNPADPVVRHLQARIQALTRELEVERVRLAACGVVAMANTPDSAAKAREMLPEYRSASCDDVANVVDREIRYRAALEMVTIDASKTSPEKLAEMNDSLIIDNRYLRGRVAQLTSQMNEVVLAIPGTRYMDPPDGGDVSLGEQVRRMALDLGAVTAQRNSLEGALELMLERIPEPPDHRCNCHISPPCNDCVNFGGEREAFEVAKEALASLKGE